MPGEIQENKKIKSVRQQNKFYIISFYDIVSCETAAKLRGATLKIKRSGMPELEDGVFFHEQIIGLRVITTGGDDCRHCGRDIRNARQRCLYREKR